MTIPLCRRCRLSITDKDRAEYYILPIHRKLIDCLHKIETSIRRARDLEWADVLHGGPREAYFHGWMSVPENVAAYIRQANIMDEEQGRETERQNAEGKVYRLFGEEAAREWRADMIQEVADE